MKAGEPESRKHQNAKMRARLKRPWCVRMSCKLTGMRRNTNVTQKKFAKVEKDLVQRLLAYFFLTGLKAAKGSGLLTGGAFRLPLVG